MKNQEIKKLICITSLNRVISARRLWNISPINEWQKNVIRWHLILESKMNKISIKVMTVLAFTMISYNANAQIYFNGWANFQYSTIPMFSPYMSPQPMFYPHVNNYYLPSNLNRRMPTISSTASPVRPRKTVPEQLVTKPLDTIIGSGTRKSASRALRCNGLWSINC